MMPGRDERGAILLHALMFTTLVTAVAAGVAIVSRMETLVAGHFRQRHELAAAAVAGAEIAVQDLRGIANWSDVLSGSRQAAFVSGALSTPIATGGQRRAICCGAGSLTGSLDAETGASWTPFGWTTLAGLTGLPSPISAHVIAWVGDDVADPDGDPATDANGIISLHVEALAPSGARRVVQATVGRGLGPAPFLTVLLWREW